MATGSGGQYIVVVPDLDLVAAITADFQLTDSGGWTLVPMEIIPAVVR